ncbi:MAG: glycosyltransferase, partial [Candidatus Shapirobacteria bacterium]|nr:glycosyltransferase [Candidatus Shapirobacteria bacterium]
MPRKFKIAIDVSPLNDGNSKRGVGFYTKHLVNALQKEIKYNPDFQHYQISLIEDCKSKIDNYDLIHYPYFDPFKLTLPSQKKPYIVTCHDLIPRAFKKHFPVGIKGELKWLIQKHRLQKAAYIICPSHSAKYQIIDQIKYPVDRIYTTYEAAAANFEKISNKVFLSKIKDKY